MASQPAELLSKIDDKQKQGNSRQDIKADFDLKEQKQADALIDSKIFKEQVRSAVIAAPYIPQFQVQQGAMVVKPKVKAEQLQTFLDHIARGRQDEAEAMLKANKDLALASGDVTDHAKRTFKNITGLQYAVWALDWKMWTMLLPYLSPEAAKEQAQGFKTGSWVKEHAEHANWKNLTDALQVYIDRAQSWDWQVQRNNVWVEQVGGAQFKLPIHVLQEYNNYRQFQPCPNFSAQYWLRRLLPNWLDNGLIVGKFDFGILRGVKAWGTYGSYASGREVHLVAGDRSALISLYDIRIQQRGELVAQLLLNDLSLVDSKISKDQVPKAFIAAHYIPQFQVRQAAIITELNVDAKQLQTFLNHIARGRQDEAEAMLKANKDLALASGDITDHAKRTFRNITGFQYAVWALDWKMWTMLLPYLSPEAAKEQANGFTQSSWVKEHGEHANWKNLTNALQVCIDKYCVLGSDLCDQHWLEQVGDAQFKLPVHVLQEYNNPNRPFEPCPNFSAQYPLQRSLPDWLDKGISDTVFDFGVLRCHFLELWRSGEDIGAVRLPDEWIAADQSALISLYDNRVQQRSELVDQILRRALIFSTLEPVRGSVLGTCMPYPVMSIVAAYAGCERNPGRGITG